MTDILFLQSEKRPDRPLNTQRDTDTLAGKLTHADRARIAKAWARASKLGALRVIQIQMRRDAKRGGEHNDG